MLTATEYESKIAETIRTVINQFHRKPHNFFNEHEFHNYCYHVFYSKKEFSRQYVTSDGKRTSILHPEYPTLKRFRKKTISVNPKGDRARYDMAILNPDFIEQNTFEKVRNRDISLFTNSDFTSPNLIAAIEFKFIITHGKQSQDGVSFDILKLRMADEALLKYLLVFSNTQRREIDYFHDLDASLGIKLAYVCVDEDSGKKRMAEKLIPKGWIE